MSFASPSDRPVVPNVLVEHLEEIAYLSIQRRKLLFSPEIPLRRLREHDERIEAHLDGLREGGAAAVRIAENKLGGEDAWFVYAAARVWLAQGQPDASLVLQRLKTVPPELAPAWKEALRSVPVDLVRKTLPLKIADDVPATTIEILLDAWAWHNLLSHDAATSLLASPDPRLRFVMARHGVSGSPIPLEDTEPFVRRAALWNLLLRDSRAGLNYTRRVLQNGDSDPFLARVLGLFGERADVSLLVSLLSRNSVTLAAIAALRDLAFADVADVLVNYMEVDDEAIASAAGAAVDSLVGRIPPIDAAAEKPLPQGIRPLQFRWQQARPKMDLSGRRLNGSPFPWVGDPGDQPMECLWRASLTDRKPETDWLRREVPDGFYTGFPSSGALPGE